MLEEIEIEKAEDLSSQGDFVTSLGMHQEMLHRAQDDGTRLRLLFGVVLCSTRLGLQKVTNDAIQEMDSMPDPKECRLFADFIKATQLFELSRAQEALDLIDANLKSEYMERQDSQDWKYQHLFYKGMSLTRLAQCSAALIAFDAANAIQADGKFETDILIARSNCLTTLKRYEEAFEAASRVTTRDGGELGTLALQYMAECRMWQGRVSEALAIYLELQKKLPSKHVEEKRFQRGINRAIAFLEEHSTQRKPF